MAIKSLFHIAEGVVLHIQNNMTHYEYQKRIIEIRYDAWYWKTYEEGGYKYLTPEDMKWIDKNAREVNYTMTDFLPDNYEIPEEPSRYTRFDEGDTRLRILSSPILGWEWWVQDGEKKKPMRVKKEEEVPQEIKVLEGRDASRHFWAMVVYNYNLKVIQVWEITQKTIMKVLKQYIADEDWGSPKDYDIVVNKTGEKLETEYMVTPKPAKELDKSILELYDTTQIRLEALYESKDPFEVEKKEENK